MNIQEKEFLDLISEVDVNHDNMIDFAEFIDMMKKNLKD